MLRIRSCGSYEGGGTGAPRITIRRFYETHYLGRNSSIPKDLLSEAGFIREWMDASIDFGDSKKLHSFDKKFARNLRPRRRMVIYPCVERGSVWSFLRAACCLLYASSYLADVRIVLNHPSQSLLWFGNLES